ncbi:MAG: 3'(2'),5'-bisphosphate nucleotidase CysQ [Rhodospirillaceae bacterium]
MNSLVVADLLPALRKLALAAGEVVLHYYRQGTEIITKADGSPVTEADRAAEALILPELRHLLPGVPIIAEEAAAAGDVPEVGRGRFWLVDPLDGTREFISRNGEFTVNIALIEAGRAVAGVVLAPVTGDLYAGAVGVGAFLARTGDPDRLIAVRTPPADGWIAVGSRSHGDRAAEDRYLAPYPIRERRSRGSSLKFCLVAEGVADIYPRFGPTCEWDTAAGHAVLTAAGGRIETLEGEPLTYGKPGFLNPHFIAYGAASAAA